MKTPSIYLFIILVFLCSCSSEEETLSDSIIGLWNITDLKVESLTDATELNVAFTGGCGDFLGSNICFSFDFKEDGSVFVKSLEDQIDDSSTAMYTVNELTNQISICDEECLDLLVDGIQMTNTRELDESQVTMTFTKM